MLFKILQGKPWCLWRAEGHKTPKCQQRYTQKDGNIVEVAALLYTCELVKECINTTMNMALDLETDLKFACKAGIRKAAVYELMRS